jgi:hypothetical protein
MYLFNVFYQKFKLKENIKKFMIYSLFNINIIYFLYNLILFKFLNFILHIIIFSKKSLLQKHLKFCSNYHNFLLSLLTLTTLI